MNARRRPIVQYLLPRLTLCVMFSVLVGTHSRPAFGQIDIWIDPGHGGDDPGAYGFNGSAVPNEKQLTIAVASNLHNRLIALGYEFTYRIQNHDTTYFEPVIRRDIANGDAANDDNLTASCRLLLSIHMNSFGSASTFGTETYYAKIKADPKKKTAYRADSTAAAEIHADLMTYANLAFLGCSQDRGIKAMNWDVLAGTRMPALLFEVCFISNGCQWNNIITAGDQSLIAQGIAAGVSGYLPLGLQQAPLEPPHNQAAQRTNATPATTTLVTVSSLQEGFDGATFPPTGWSTQTAGLAIPYKWHRTADPLYVGAGAGSVLVGGESPSGINEWLISPGVTLTGSDDAIRFSWLGSQRWSSVLDASLNIRAVGTSVWTPLWSIASNEPMATPFIYRERVVDLSAWMGMNVEFGFRVVGTNGADFALDDVEVGDFDPTVAASNDVCANASALSGVFSIQEVTCYAANDLDPYTGPPGSCVGSQLDGPDVFFEIVAAWGDSLHASVTAEWNAGLYLVDDCLTPVCLAGGYPEDARTKSVVDYRFAPGGTYYLVVDGVEGSCGPYELTGEIIPSPTGVIDGGAAPALRLAARPNPAGGPITLFATFPSSRGTRLTVEIYDVAGRRLRYVEGSADAGEFSFTWDHRDQSGAPVASGLYFARLQVDGESVVQKFVILR